MAEINGIVSADEQTVSGIIAFAKGDKGDKGDSYVITEADYQEIEKIVKADGEIKQLSTNMATLVGDTYDLSDISSFTVHKGTLTTSGEWNVLSNHEHIFIPVEKAGCKLTIKSDEARETYFAGVTEYVEAVSGERPMYSAADGWTGRKTIPANTERQFDIPDDVNGLILVVKVGGNQRNFQKFNIHKDGSGEISVIKSKVSTLETKVDRLTKPVRWCAMGDSITEGHISFISSDSGKPTTATRPDDAWVNKMANIVGWNVTNLGIGGTGWNKATNAEVDEGVDTTSAHKVAGRTDFTQFDLVTLAYGINDWKGNRATGEINADFSKDDTPTTTIEGMRKTIETILASNPLIKIIVITPLNCAGYTDATTGDFAYANDDNWAIGHAYSKSGTLEQFTKNLIDVCNHYGVQYIDQTHYSCVNRVNMRSCLTDGIHPNKETYTVLAEELAGKITFKC